VPACASIMPAATAAPGARPGCATASGVSPPMRAPAGAVRGGSAPRGQILKAQARHQHVGPRAIGPAVPLARNRTDRAGARPARPPCQEISEVAPLRRLGPARGRAAFEPEELGQMHLGRHGRVAGRRLGAVIASGDGVPLGAPSIPAGIGPSSAPRVTVEHVAATHGAPISPGPGPGPGPGLGLGPAPAPAAAMVARSAVPVAARMSSARRPAVAASGRRSAMGWARAAWQRAARVHDAGPGAAGADVHGARLRWGHHAEPRRGGVPGSGSLLGSVSSAAPVPPPVPAPVPAPRSASSPASGSSPRLAPSPASAPRPARRSGRAARACRRRSHRRAARLARHAPPDEGQAGHARGARGAQRGGAVCHQHVLGRAAPISAAACRNRSGAGLPSGTMIEL
jgi:hypothetical protein